jgi:hypothetical protein
VLVTTDKSNESVTLLIPFVGRQKPLKPPSHTLLQAQDEMQWTLNNIANPETSKKCTPYRALFAAIFSETMQVQSPMGTFLSCGNATASILQIG